MCQFYIGGLLADFRFGLTGGVTEVQVLSQYCDVINFLTLAPKFIFPHPQVLENLKSFEGPDSEPVDLRKEFLFQGIQRPSLAVVNKAILLFTLIHCKLTFVSLHRTLAYLAIRSGSYSSLFSVFYFDFNVWCVLSLVSHLGILSFSCCCYCCCIHLGISWRAEGKSMANSVQ